MPAYAEGGVSAHLIAAVIDNNRQRLRARRRRAIGVAISRCLRSSSRVQRQERVRRDASTSHADAGGYLSAEPFAKAPRARSASTAPW